MATPRTRGLGTLIALCAISPTIHAAEWTVAPTITASEMYSDNIFLSPAPYQLSDFATTITPGITIRGTGERLKASLNYSLQDINYAKYSSMDYIIQQLNATGNATLIDQTLFMDASASIYQQPLYLSGPIGMGNNNPTGNLANITTTTISPYVTHRFNTFATGMARYTHQTMDFSQAGPTSNAGYGYNAYAPGGMFNSTTDTALATLNSGSDFNNLLWGLNLTNSRISYAGTSPMTLAQYSANLGYLITPRFKIIATGGYEDDSYSYIGQNPRSNFWSLGFDWAPSVRTKLEVAEGERFFGRTHTLKFTHNARRTSWNASYVQDVTTMMQQQQIPPSVTLDLMLQQQIPDSATRQQVVQSMLAALGPQSTLFAQNVMTNQIYLMKMFSTSVALTLPKDTFLLTIFNTKTSPLQQANAFLPIIPGALSYMMNTDQYGGTLSWNKQLNPLLSANANVSTTYITFPGQTLEEKMRFFTAGLSRKLGPKLNANLLVRHQAMDSTPANIGYSYSENAVIASLMYLF